MLIAFYIAPKLVDVKDRLSQNVGTKLKIHCNIQQGSKPMTFEWYKNTSRIDLLNMMMTENNRGMKIVHSEDESLLTIFTLNRTHSGNYSCHVRNRYGSDTQFTVLTVKGLSFDTSFSHSLFFDMLTFHFFG